MNETKYPSIIDWIANSVFENPNIFHKKKHIHFSQVTYLCLIPTREEYLDIKDDLYWKHADYAESMRQVNSDIQMFQTRMGVPYYLARKYYFQNYCLEN